MGFHSSATLPSSDSSPSRDMLSSKAISASSNSIPWPPTKFSRMRLATEEEEGGRDMKGAIRIGQPKNSRSVAART